MCLKWLNDRASVLKTGNLRFKSQLRHKIFSQYLSEHFVSHLRRCAGSDGSVSASFSADPGFDLRRGVNFHLKIFNFGARWGGDEHFLIPNTSAVHLLRRHIVLLIVICLPNGDVFQEEQAMSQHRVSPSPFLSSSSDTTQTHIQSP